MRFALAVTATAIGLAACGGPLGPIAGGRLAGKFATEPYSEWTVAADHQHAIVEVRPDEPYSVTVNHYLVEGRLYLDIGKEAGWHRWRRYIRKDNRVRVRFGDTIYPANATTVSDPAEISALLPTYFAKDGSEPAPGCEPPFGPECFPDTTFVRLDPD